MTCMSYNKESARRYLGYCLQLTNWVLDSGATFHMSPAISDFIPGSLVEMDKYIEFAYESYVTAKQAVEVQIKMFGDNGKTFITMLYNVLFAPDLCV